MLIQKLAKKGKMKKVVDIIQEEGLVGELARHTAHGIFIEPFTNPVQVR